MHIVISNALYVRLIVRIVNAIHILIFMVLQILFFVLGSQVVCIAFLHTKILVLYFLYTINIGLGYLIYSDMNVLSSFLIQL